MRTSVTVLSWLAAAATFVVVLSALGVGSPGASHLAPFAALLVMVVMVADLVLRVPDRFAVRRAALASASFASLVLLLPDARGLAGDLMSERAATGPGALRLVELNVWDLNPDRARTIRWLRETNADIIVLAEAREPFIADLVREFPGYPTMVTCEDRPYCGTVILSKLPGRLLTGGAWVADGLNRSTHSDARMAFAAVELVAPSAAGSGRPISVFAAHLDRNGFSGITEQQVDALLASTKAAVGRASPSAILAGDLNASPWSPQLRRLDASAGLSRISRFASTWPSGWRVGSGIVVPPFLAIDQIYFGCGWTARSMEVGPEVGSDHRPLLATFESNSAPTSNCLGLAEAADTGGD